MLPKKNALVRKNVMIWQKYGVIQNVCHSGKRGGKIDQKKVTKNYVGGGFAAKKCDATHSKEKTRFCEWRSFQCWLVLLHFLWVYLLMILLAFYKTNKPYTSK